MLRLERKDFNQEAKCSEAGKDVLVAHSEGTAWAPRSGSAFSVAMLRCTKQCNSCVLPAFQCGCCPGAPPGRIPELSLSPQECYLNSKWSLPAAHHHPPGKITEAKDWR
ncbi:uncharacterized protein AAES06_023241 isoform 1-T1 [Glossophaga mutica]